MVDSREITVYRHVRLDTNEVFYVGIGKESRAYEKGTRRNKWWNKIVSKTDYRVDILFNDLTWEEACEKEKEFISLYGRRDLSQGSLVNHTDGGDGSVGYITSEETKKKLSDAHLGKKLSKSHKLKISIGNKGKSLSESTKKAISKANIGNTAFLGKTHTKETKYKISNSNSGKKRSQESKDRIGAARVGAKWMNNGKESTLVHPNKISEMIWAGYTFGRTKFKKHK